MIDILYIVYGLVAVVAGLIFWLFLKPKFLGENDVEFTVPLVRSRARLIDRDIGTISEVVGIKKLGEHKALLTLKEGDIEFHRKYSDFQLRPVSEDIFQVIAGRASPLFEVLPRDATVKMDDGQVMTLSSYKKQYELEVSDKEAERKRRRSLEIDMDKKISDVVDKLTDIEKAKAKGGTTYGQK